MLRYGYLFILKYLLDAYIAPKNTWVVEIPDEKIYVPYSHCPKVHCRKLVTDTQYIVYMF